jgi:hypothetical protein
MISLGELLAALCLLGLAWLWWDGLRSREQALLAAVAACRQAGVQWLDQSLALERLRMARDEAGHLGLVRVYCFEFSDTGNNRCKARLALRGPVLLWLDLYPEKAVIDIDHDASETHSGSKHPP